MAQGVLTLRLPGASGNYVSVPDAANLDITGPIEVVLRITPAQWPFVADAAVFGKMTATGNQLSYEVRCYTSGVLMFCMSVDGAATIQGFSTAAPFTAGTTYWIKVVRNDATGTTIFSYAPDAPTEPSTWTEISRTTVGAGSAMFSGSSPVYIGPRSGTGLAGFIGAVRRAILRNGIGGPVVLDINESNLTTAGQTSFVATSGQTATVAQSGGNVIVQAA